MRTYAFYITILSSLIMGCGLNHNTSPNATPQQNQTVAEHPFSDIKLQTITGKDTILKEIANNKASVFVFLSPECPLSQSYSLTLNKFSEKYRVNHICFYGIFPGKSYGIDEMNDFQKKYSIEFTLLVDTAYTLTHILGATITPEAFVVDDKGVTLYSGRIDNWAYEISKKRPIITEHNLQDALDCIANNTAITISKTKAVGCFIESASK